MKEKGLLCVSPKTVKSPEFTEKALTLKLRVMFLLALSEIRNAGESAGFIVKIVDSGLGSLHLKCIWWR